MGRRPPAVQPELTAGGHEHGAVGQAVLVEFPARSSRRLPPRRHAGEPGQAHPRRRKMARRDPDAARPVFATPMSTVPVRTVVVASIPVSAVVVVGVTVVVPRMMATVVARVVPIRLPPYRCIDPNVDLGVGLGRAAQQHRQGRREGGYSESCTHGRLLAGGMASSGTDRRNVRARGECGGSTGLSRDRLPGIVLLRGHSGTATSPKGRRTSTRCMGGKPGTVEGEGRRHGAPARESPKNLESRGPQRGPASGSPTPRTWTANRPRSPTTTR